MPKISIIVPVYNTEKYLTRCINSILLQTLTDYELILIDDGSSDNCGSICDYYAQFDSRIRVIHQFNEGVSAARNKGLMLASGEYISFIDSDDWIEPDMFKVMIEKTQLYNCDIVMCDCIKEYNNHSELYTHNIRGGLYDYEQLKKEYYPHLIMMENIEYPPTISNCLFIFRRGILQETSFFQEDFLFDPSEHEERQLRYVEGVKNCEDLLFGAEIMYRVKSFYYLKGKAFYHYCRENPKSASCELSIDIWSDFITLHTISEKVFLQDHNYDFQHQVDLLLLSFLYIAINTIRYSKMINKQEKRSRINQILHENSVCMMFNRVKVLKLPINWKLKIYTLVLKYKLEVILLLRG